MKEDVMDEQGNRGPWKRTVPPKMPVRTPVMFAVLMLWIVPVLRAQNVTVNATVDATTIGVKEHVSYSIEVKGGQLSQIATPQPPKADGLNVVSRFASTSQNISLFNGRMQQSVSYQWDYVPVREGAVSIPSVTVKVGSKSYRTKAIGLTVVAQAQRPARRRPDPFAQLTNPFARGATPPHDAGSGEPDAKDLFIRVVPSTRSAYQNEQVTIEYQLFFREGIQLRQSRLTDSWDAEGFWREEMDVDTRPIPRSVVENGLRFNTIVLKRAAVFPTHPGKLHVDPLRIETEAVEPTRSRDPFARFFSSSRFVPVDVASDPLTIDAKPLPAGAPAGFNGAVGQFQMIAQLDRATVEVGASVQVKVVIRGAGNLATLSAPVLHTPGAFEKYDPQVESSIDRSGSEIRGTKTFTFVLVPRSHGTFDLPPVRFIYFDPKLGHYQTHATTLPAVHVTGDEVAVPAASATAAGLPVDDIAGLLTDRADWEALHQTPLHESVWAYAWLFIPLLSLGGLTLYHRRSLRLATDRKYARNRRAHPLARKHLKRAETLLLDNEPRALYADVEQAVLSFIGNRLNIAETGLTRAQLDGHLAETDVPGDVRVRLAHLLEECDRMRFAPVLPDRNTMRTALDRAAELIVELDGYFKQQTATVGG